MAIIRSILGALILFFDKVFAPSSVVREACLQEEIDGLTAKLSLYQYPACPFCVKVRRAMKRYNLSISLLDAKRSEVSRNELVKGGGKLKVPCLKIEEEDGSVRWMYESTDIVDYLQSRFCSKSAGSVVKS